MKFYALVMTTQQFPGNCNNIINQSSRRLKEPFLSISEVRCHSQSFPCRSVSVVPRWIKAVFVVGSRNTVSCCKPFPETLEYS